MMVTYEVEEEEYKASKMRLYEKYAVGSRPFFVPRTKNWHLFLVRFMESSNHYMNKPMTRYECGNKRFDFFLFNRAKVMVEWWTDKKYLLVVLPHKIERNFKSILMRMLMEREETCRDLIESRKDDSAETMYSISWKWAKSLDERPDPMLLQIDSNIPQHS